MTPEEIIALIASDMDSTANVASYIALAKLNTSATYFGASYNYAVALLAAHEWYLSTKRKGAPGVGTYRAAGRLMESTGGVGVIRNSYELSNYGMQLLTLIRQCGVGASTTAYNIFLSELS